MIDTRFSSRAPEPVVRTFTVARDAAAGRSARAAIRDVAEHLGMAAVLDDVLLVVTELVNNALFHSDGAIGVRLTRTPACLRIEVTDDAWDTLPQLRPFDLRSSGGRGLHIVQSIAAGWGHVVEGERKTVWCDIDPTPPLRR